ncbi:keratin-associated protein 5-4 isoform X6 [Hemibagrus wyckioides]|uniref:keratin-associated protein 5-4 isoform X6 n=1 Tax=Hemibagrus wyckioides TaxID=337641 RepID=UPI00266D1BA7|nr:keratin-associated protein 5-4 isoform X6 [Hemibagrus wyckioides]
MKRKVFIFVWRRLRSSAGGPEGVRSSAGGSEGMRSSAGGPEGVRSSAGGSEGMRSSAGGSEGVRSSAGGSEGMRSSAGGSEGVRSSAGGSEGMRSSAGGSEGVRSSVRCEKSFELSGCWSVYGCEGEHQCFKSNAAAATGSQWRERSSGVELENLWRKEVVELPSGSVTQSQYQTGNVKAAM